LPAEAQTPKLVRLLLYYITDRTQFPGNEPARRARLLDKIEEAARATVDYIQLREKDLSARDLERLAHQAMQRISAVRSRSRLLVNSRTDVAIAAAADGVHLRADDISAADARVVLSKTGVTRPVVAVSCHSVEAVSQAEAHGADFVVFAPVFEKGKQPGVGLESLRAACHRSASAANPVPVLALGGVTLDNARACIDAGAAGIAAIRLFPEHDIAQVVARLRG
jgi:thiamine-phosphate pyrophosphorylase